MKKQKKSKIQVKKECYFNKNKIGTNQWINSLYQINDTVSLNPKKILLIGVGNGVVSYYLKNIGYDITTFDFDPELKPDIINDVKNVSAAVKNNKFDLIICAHVLEHLPFEHFDYILKCFSKIAEYVILQLPPTVMQVRFNFAIQPKLIDWKFNINVPILFWKRYKFNGQHYWQLYRKNSPMRKVKKKIENNFLIMKAYQCPENHYSYNFVLKSKNYNPRDF